LVTNVVTRYLDEAARFLAAVKKGIAPAERHTWPCASRLSSFPRCFGLICVYLSLSVAKIFGFERDEEISHK
jgi:hypothetical protein